MAENRPRTRPSSMKDVARIQLAKVLRREWWARAEDRILDARPALSREMQLEELLRRIKRLKQFRDFILVLVEQRGKSGDSKNQRRILAFEECNTQTAQAELAKIRKNYMITQRLLDGLHKPTIEAMAKANVMRHSLLGSSVNERKMALRGVKILPNPKSRGPKPNQRVNAITRITVKAYEEITGYNASNSGLGLVPATEEIFKFLGIMENAKAATETATGYRKSVKM